MATAAKLVADLSVVLRGMRSHEGVIAGRLAQASTDDVRRSLRQTADTERSLAGELARVSGGLGAPIPRLRPSWVPSPTSVVATLASQTQPLGEALVAEAAAVRMLADRCRVAHHLAVAVDERAVADTTGRVSDLYDGYADWLVRTAAALVVDEDDADLRPSVSQRLAGRAKDAVGVPARVARHAVQGIGSIGGAAVTATGGAEPGDLPVTGYDDRSAADAVKAIRGLDRPDDVAAVLAYEAAHKDRKTVLDAGDARLVQLSG